MNENQVAYVYDRLIRESGGLISDVLEITNSLNIEGLLMTVDIEKAFDSINHSLLICLFKKFGFGNDFQKWNSVYYNYYHFFHKCYLGEKEKPTGW